MSAGIKIGVIVPNVGMSANAVAERHAFLKAGARPNTEIVFHVNQRGPKSIESRVEADEAGVEIGRTIRALSGQGYDAFITWCAGDPGLEATREISSVPVVGPGQAALHYAGMLGTRLTWLAPTGQPSRIQARVHAHQMDVLLARVRIIGTPVLELRRDMGATRDRLNRLIDEAAREDSADVVILGCMALFGVAATLDAPVPVIDPALSALTMAESLVTMGLTHFPAQ